MIISNINKNVHNAEIQSDLSTITEWTDDTFKNMSRLSLIPRILNDSNDSFVSYAATKITLNNIASIDNSYLYLYPNMDRSSASLFPNITDVNLPNATEISSGLFCNSTNLVNINMPKITKVPDYLFYSCSSLEDISSLSNITYVGDNAFNGTNVSDISTLKDVSYIGNNAFNLLSGISDISEFKNITYYGRG